MRESKIRPSAKRSLGQNFLVDPNYVKKIVDALGDISSSHVIEIGPGRGALTGLLAQKAGFLTAIELDSDLSSGLSIDFKGRPNVRVIEADILETSIARLASIPGFERVKIIGNLPYNISTPVLRKLADSTENFSEAVLMLQKEVAQRISAPPGNRDRGYLTVLTEFYFEVQELFEVPPNAFRPRPKVRSSVVRLAPVREAPGCDPVHLQALLSACFQTKRKTIANNLKRIEGMPDAKAILKAAGIDPGLRPEALTLGQWAALANQVANI